jgi:hypothetical protein
MTSKQMKEIFDRIQTWPPERHADVIAVVKLMESSGQERIESHRRTGR